MQNHPVRTVIAVLLLAAGLVVVYSPQWLLPARSTFGNDQAGLTYVADLDYWQRTPRERLVEATVPFDLAGDLSQTPLQIGEWRGQDVPETNLEVFILLEPEQFVQRRYRDSAGHSLWLHLIGSRKSRSFHPPDISYDADGWQVSVSSQAIPLEGGGEIHGLWLEAEKQLQAGEPVTANRAFYFYLFPDSARDQAAGIVLFKITTPAYGSVEETLAIQAGFLGQLFSRARPIQ